MVPTFTSFAPLGIVLVALLGVGTFEQSDAFPGAPITIVVGADFAAANGG